MIHGIIGFFIGVFISSVIFSISYNNEVKHLESKSLIQEMQIILLESILEAEGYDIGLDEGND